MLFNGAMAIDLLISKCFTEFSLLSLILLVWQCLPISCETYTPQEAQEKLGYAYEFKIHVDAAKEECFYQHVQQHSTLYVAFQVGDQLSF